MKKLIITLLLLVFCSVNTVVFAENPINCVDYVVNINHEGDARILQLTDTQIIESEQIREELTLNDTATSTWSRTNKEICFYSPVREAIETTAPDLIIITGDLVYGKYDDSGEALLDLIKFMDSFEIPWAPVFGNHDNESTKGVGWQCQQLQNSKYCLFKQRNLTGNGNYTVGIAKNNVLQRVFFMLDSNGCGDMSTLTLENGHSKKTAGFGNDQIEWYKNTAQNIKSKYSSVKLSFAFHIQPVVFKNAFKKYGFTNNATTHLPINLDAVGQDGDIGYIGRVLKSAWDTDYSVWKSFKELGVDSIFVGHEHCNSASVKFENVIMQYGQKSSLYDRVNYQSNDNKIFGGTLSLSGTPLLGGTLMKINSDGNFTERKIIIAKGNNTTVNETKSTFYKNDINDDILSSTTIVLKIGSKEVLVNGNNATVDAASEISNNRTMVPARFVLENLGATVEWNESEPDLVAINRGNDKITIYINQNNAIINDKETMIDASPYTKNGRTYLPLRFISENLGYRVIWNQNNQSVTISK